MPVVLLCLALVACTSQQATSPPTAGQPTDPPASVTSTSSPLATPSAAPGASPSVAPASPGSTPSDGPPTPTEPPTPSPEPGGRFEPDAIRLTVEPFASGLAPLTFVTHAGDGSGRLFAVEQRGMIWTLDAEGSLAASPFLDIRERVRSGGERGLLGLAFHPDFESNGRLFVNYTDTRGDTVVSEFGLQADGSADPASERVLLGFNQPFSNHNGGMIAFGPDRMLHIATGDGGSGGDPRGNGQSLDTLLGKILRIDVDSGDPYAIPTDNPFAGGGGRPEIWSYGLRNPWRLSFDRRTGAMFIGDVGQITREEIDAEPAGQGGRNYGWNVVEGDRCFVRNDCNRRGLTPPVAVYGRDGNCAVTGGYVYRGAQFPDLYGGYIYSDYCGGQLWALNAEAAVRNGEARVFQLGQTQLRPTSFGEDEAGELYLVHHPGEIYRVVATPR